MTALADVQTQEKGMLVLRHPLNTLGGPSEQTTLKRTVTKMIED